VTPQDPDDLVARRAISSRDDWRGYFTSADNARVVEENVGISSVRAANEQHNVGTRTKQR
jgi:hypothetical protein